MSKVFQIKNVFLKESFFKSINELYFLENKSKNKIMEYGLNLKNIDYKMINERDMITTLGMTLVGYYKEEENVINIFECGASYCLISEISGYTSEEIDIIQNVNVASFIYPYVRSEINRILSDGLYPKIQLQPINFSEIYFQKQEKVKREIENLNSEENKED